MGNALVLRLFGGATILQNGAPLAGVTSQKARALLFYLVCHPHPIQRDVVATLLFGDSLTHQAASNLRTLLARLKPIAAFLEVDRQTVGVHPNAAITVDVVDFEADLTNAFRLVPPGTPLTQEASDTLENALRHYQGEFLMGFYLQDAPEWEEWVTVVRERWHHQAVEGYARLVEGCISLGAHRRGIGVTRRLLELDPLREEAHRQMMTLLARDHQRVAALAQYEQCRRILAEELGVDPSRETAELHERILTLELGEARDVPSAPLRPHQLPRALTPFVGRESELTHICTTLKDSDCHLVTVVGPGGMGKSRLAMQAAWRMATDPSAVFPDGVFWIPFAATTTLEHFAITIADALKIELQGKNTPNEQIHTYLRDQSMLLVLDNLEHLTGIADAVVALLQAAPRLKVLATSREPLDLQAEWLFPLDGLSCPDGLAPPEIMEQFEACALFLRYVRRLRPKFRLTADDSAALVRLCVLVDGMPLGLELAATFLHHLTLPELVTELERDLDVLTVTLRDLPERHRSLRAVYEQSWRRLSESAQVLLAQLALFRRGFSRVAAEQIAGATLAELLALEQKSLLTRDRNGRYELHELLRQFSAEKLVEMGEATEGHRRHADYFTRLVERQEVRLRGREALQALETLRTEVDNVRTAWATAVAQRDTGAIQRAMEGLTRFYNLRGWYQEGATAMATAVAMVTVLPDSAAHRALHGALLVRQGKCLEITDFDVARETYTASIPLLRDGGNSASLAMALTGLGYLGQLRGAYDEAEAYLTESLALCREVNDEYGEAVTLNTLCQTLQRRGKLEVAREAGIAGLAIRRRLHDGAGIAASLNNLGLLDCQLGAYATAYEEFTESLALFRTLNVRVGIANGLNGLCQVAYFQKNMAEAIRYARESLEVYREIKDVWGEGLVLNNLGYLANAQADYTAAIAYLTGAVTLFRTHHIHTGLSGALRNLGNAYRELGNLAQAEAEYQEALQVAQGGGGVSYIVQVLVQYGWLLAQKGAIFQSLTLLAFSKAHSALNHDDRRRAEAWFTELASHQPTEAVTTALATADALTLQDVVAELLDPISAKSRP